jgi:alkylated DNA nucleotide flippase Atl1
MPDFFDRVWEVVACVPEGRVTTYGHIARHLGLGRSARLVGHALHAVGRAGARRPDLPCHRVVNRSGALSGRLHFETPTMMEECLRAEGVAFLEDGRVDLERHLWDPAAPG